MSSLTKDIQILLKFENDMFFPELKRDKLYKLSHEKTLAFVSTVTTG